MEGHVKALLGGVSLAGFGAVFYFTQVPTVPSTPFWGDDHQAAAPRRLSPTLTSASSASLRIPPPAEREAAPALHYRLTQIELYQPGGTETPKTRVDDPEVLQRIERSIGLREGQYSLDQLEILADELEALYQDRGWVLAAVQVPAQRVEQQRVELELVKGPFASLSGVLNGTHGAQSTTDAEPLSETEQRAMAPFDNGVATFDSQPLPTDKAGFALRSLAALPDAATAGGVQPHPLRRPATTGPRGSAEQLLQSLDDSVSELISSDEMAAAQEPLIDYPDAEAPAEALPLRGADETLVGAPAATSQSDSRPEAVIPRKSDRPFDLDEGPRIGLERIELFLVRQQQDLTKTPVEDAEVEAHIERFMSARQGQFSIGELQQLADELTRLYRGRGLILATVYLPAQDIAGQRLELHLLPGELAAVVPQGQQSYRSEQLQRAFAEVVDRPLEKDAVESALLTLLDYPGLQATGVLEPGERVGTSQLAVTVSQEDRFDGVVYGDNYGSSFTGKERLGLGLGFNNPLGLIDRLQLDLLVQNKPSDDGTRSVDHTLYGGINYSFKPIDPSYTFGFSLSHNSYDVGQDLSAFEFTGETDQLRLYGRKQLLRGRTQNRFVEVAFASKTAVSERAGVQQSRDQLSNLELGFGFDRLDRLFVGGYTEGQVRWVHGFEGLLGAMDDHDPDASRTAESGKVGGGFDKLKFDLRRYQNLSTNTALVLRLNGQYSSDPLVSLEQFGLGGVTSVRAYSGAEYMADKGVFVGAELRANAPGFSDKPAFNQRSWGQVLQLSLFVDYAKGYKNDALANEEADTDLSGIGFGVRLAPTSRLTLNASVATPLGSVDASNGKDPQLFADISYSF